MKLVAVLGSNRPGSRSNVVAEKIFHIAKEHGCEVKTYDVNEMNLHGCKGCGACRDGGTDCIIEDDMQEYYNDLRESDVLLVTSPNYFSQITGPMITFLNRHYCLSNKNSQTRIESGKKVIGIFSQGAPESYNAYEDNYNWYLSILRRHMDLVGKVVVAGDSNLSEDGNVMTKAKRLILKCLEE